MVYAWYYYPYTLSLSMVSVLLWTATFRWRRRWCILSSKYYCTCVTTVHFAENVTLAVGVLLY